MSLSEAECVCDEQIVLLSVPKNPFFRTYHTSRCVTCPWPMISVDNRKILWGAARQYGERDVLKHTRGISLKISYVCKAKGGRTEHRTLNTSSFCDIPGGGLMRGDFSFLLGPFRSVAFLCI